MMAHHGHQPKTEVSPVTSCGLGLPITLSSGPHGPCTWGEEAV